MNFFERIGQSVLRWLTVGIEFIRLTLETLYWIIFGPFRGKGVNRQTWFAQMVYMGNQSIMIVFFVTFFTGVVLAMQSAYQSNGMTADQIVTKTLADFGPAAFTPRKPSANELALIAKIEARDAIEGEDPLAGSDQPGAATERLRSNWDAALDTAITARSGRLG